MFLVLFSDEFDASVASLQSAAASLNADCVLLRERLVTADEASGQQQTDKNELEDKTDKKTGQFLVRERADEKVCLTGFFSQIFRGFVVEYEYSNHCSSLTRWPFNTE